MPTTSNIVWGLLEQDPAIKKAISKGLVNTTALAKYIIKTYNLNASMDAVISSIRRNIPENGENDSKEEVVSMQEIFKNTKVSSKNKVASIVLKKDQATFTLLPEVFSVFDYYGGGTLRLVQGADAIEFIFDDKNLPKFLNIFSEKKILKINKALGEIGIFFGPGVQHTPGVFATILNELALHNINVHEAISCLSEYMVYVKEEDLIKAYDLLYKLCKRFETIQKED